MSTAPLPPASIRPAIALLLLFLIAPSLHAQKTVDKIVAVVDDEVILQSEVRNQYTYLRKNGQHDDGTLWCRVMENMLQNKLLLAKARIDSITVQDARVESELDRRIRVMSSQMGGQNKLEEEVGKSILELRSDLRPEIKKQMRIKQQRQKIFEEVNITPRDVRQFYNNMPEDSIPYLPAEVALSKIVMKPEPSEASKQAARAKLAEIRARIEGGEATFEEMAKRHSEDRASAKEGGFMGQISRQDVVPEFAEIIYNLRPGKVSSPFESPFGFHLAKVHERTGQRVTVSHILIRPKINSKDEKRVKERLNKIRERILNDELSFAEAAKRYSEDRQTKDNGGIVSDPQSGDYRIPLDQLEPDLYLTIDQMKVGEISKPQEIIHQDVSLTKAYQLVWLRERYPPHKATLETDYQRFHKAAKQAKQSERLQTWLRKAREQVYINIKSERCAQALQAWGL